MKRLTAIAAALLALSGCSRQENLWDGFVNPPKEARPLVWWHWMNGNITKDGIRKDIMWMNDSGIAGFHVFDAGLASPQIVKQRLVYMTPEWNDAFSYAVSLADSLGMEVSVASSPGWSSTGGPWVTEKDAMKKIVWREIRLNGACHFRDSLPEPYIMSSTFQDVPLDSSKGAHEDPSSEKYYEDREVLALRLPDNDVTLSELGCQVTASSGDFTLEQLTNDSMSDFVRMDASDYMWIQFAFPKPQTIRSVTFTSRTKRGRGHSDPLVAVDSLQVSDDGVNFRTYCALPFGSCAEQTLDIDPVTAGWFRVKFGRPYSFDKSLNRGRNVSHLDIAKLVLNPAGRIHHFEEKAAYAACNDILDFQTPSSVDGDAVLEVVNLTDKYKDGILDWEVPEGRWAILRMGASLTGKKNHPASPEATGLEVDKLDRQAWTKYFHHYLDMYEKASSGMMGQHGIQYILTDSYEANHCNGSQAILDEFQKRRGYDPVPWLPAMCGYIVGSAEQSDAFLWDWRRTEDELFCENYAVLTDIVRKEYGMKGCYIESHENGRVFPADGMDVKRSASFPMSACWMPSVTGWPDRLSEGWADIHESASVAHIYGQNRVAAESFTQNGLLQQAYTSCPEVLKPLADLELSCGLNRFVIHESSHQPVDSLFPGLCLGRYGQWFNRHETWARYARVWIDYLARSSYLLMQGKAVSDILYYYGEDSNVCGTYSNGIPEIPDGFSFDFANPTVIRTMLKARDGRLVTKSGMSYRVLYLDSSCTQMSVDILERLMAFADAGVVICGTVPERTTGMTESRERFDALVSDIFKSGRPNVYPGATLADAISECGLEKDMDAGLSNAPALRFVHRRLGNGEIYWVSNPSSEQFDGVVSFKVKGRHPEIWQPETAGKIQVKYRFSESGTDVKLSMLPHEAYFVMFLDKTGKEDVWDDSAARPDPAVMTDLSDGWTITFQKGRGADDIVITDASTGSLTGYSNPSVAYFSGTATYSRMVDYEPVPGETARLDLGSVKNIAEVRVNGSSVAVLWHAPFVCDLSEALHSGANTVEVDVTNLWVNRIIGDAGIFSSNPVTFTGFKYYTAEDTPLPSGLIGPVTLMTSK